MLNEQIKDRVEECSLSMTSRDISPRDSEFTFKISFPPVVTQMDVSNRIPRLQNTKKSKDCFYPLIKIRTTESSEIQHLRLYYRAASKGLSSLKLYRASIMLMETTFILKEATNIGRLIKEENKNIHKALRLIKQENNNIDKALRELERSMTIGTLPSYYAATAYPSLSMRNTWNIIDHTRHFKAENVHIKRTVSLPYSQSSSAIEFLEGLVHLDAVYEGWCERFWRKHGNLKDFRDYIVEIFQRINCLKSRKK